MKENGWFKVVGAVGVALSAAFAPADGEQLLMLHLDFNSVQLKKSVVEGILDRAAAMGYNAILWEIENKVQWQCHPEIVGQEAFTKAEFREILARAKRLGLKPIPLFQILGHGEYVLMHGGHGDWMEDPAFPACYCVSKPEVRAFMKEMIHEYLELFGEDVRDFHLGCDEAAAFHTCAACRAKGTKLDLFLEHFNDVTGELRARGVKPGIWCDILFDERDNPAVKALAGKVSAWFWDYKSNEGKSPQNQESRWQGKMDVFERMGFDIFLATASESYRDSSYLPRYREHGANVTWGARYAKAHGYRGMCITSWSVHCSPKLTQYPLWEAAANVWKNPALGSRQALEETCPRHFGVPLATLESLTDWEWTICDFQGEEWGRLIKPAIPAPKSNLAEVAVRMSRKFGPEWRERIVSIAGRYRGSVERGLRELGQPKTPAAEVLKEGAELQLAYLDALTNVLTGGVLAHVPIARTTSYYAIEQAPKSAALSAEITWSLLRGDLPKKQTLAPAAFEPIPAGSIRPEGWLGRNLQMQADGLVGHLYETSPYLAPSNTWIEHTNPKASCWEEGPYWARTFVKLAVLTQDARLLAEAEKWMKAQLDQSLPDGWYGPRDRHVKTGRGPELFSHIVMNEAILTWYEYTKDARYLEMLRKFFDYLDDLPEESFLSYNCKDTPKSGNPQDWEKALGAGAKETPSYHYWHRVRGGDMLKALFRVYELTGDAKCLSVADKVFRKTMSVGGFWKHETGYAAMWANIHTVNFSERFPYGTVYWRRSGNEAHRRMGDYWYDLHMQMWGQMPRGAHAAGEQHRAGKTDPNQAFESCSVSELTRSFCLMGGVTGERKWGDRAEDMVFNYTAGTCTPDWKKIHYLNAPNMVNLDVRTNHDYYNGGGHIAYSANAYRCCLHNGSLSLPLFAENLVQRGQDGEMVLFLYAPHSGKADFGAGEVAWKMRTRYPFRETVELMLETPRPLTLRLRVPAWCRAFAVDGKELAASDGWVVCTVPAGSSSHTIAMKQECGYTFYPRNGGVSVDRGPLTYSLALGESVNLTNKLDHWTKRLGKDIKTEYLVTTPWNYALDVSKTPVYRELDYRDECFAATNACCEITAWGKRAPEWKLVRNQPGDIPFMPVEGEGDELPLRFVPMACLRCRVTVFPQLKGTR